MRGSNMLEALSFLEKRFDEFDGRNQILLCAVDPPPRFGLFLFGKLVGQLCIVEAVTILAPASEAHWALVTDEGWLL